MEDNNRKFEYGLYDIEKIQRDIERDLNLREFITDESILNPTENKPYVPLRQKTFDEHSKSLQNIVYPAVRRNTNLRYKKRRNIGAGLKIAVWLIISTIGMASLGFGLGTGWAFIRNEITHYNENEHATTYIFRETTDVPIATLADMLELIEPSVINVTTRLNGGSLSRGSGIIFYENEHSIFIVTNLYVVQGGTSWDLTFSGGISLPGHVVGSDRTLGLAVLSIYKTELIDAGIETVFIAAFGDSDQMVLGDWVFAIGNSMGEGNSITRGIISAIDVSVELSPTRTQIFLQTDAAINYGNSGGPLINTRGEIIGINYNLTDFLFGRSLVEGMGHSIPSNDVVPALHEIVNNPTPALGIGGASLTEAMAENLGIPHIGAFVTDVFPNSAAYRGGIQRGDIITGFAGQTVFDFYELRYLIRQHQVGDEVEVRLLRNQTEWLVIPIILRPPVRF